MEYRPLGRSGLKVSALTFGTMTFGGSGRFEVIGTTGADAARDQLDRALDAGVNVVDTADMYSDGASEEILGQAMEGRRDRLVLATKARNPMGEGVNDAGLSRRHLIAACDASLRRLRTDWIDLYQLHGWDGQTPLEETLSALDDLVRAGKVRYVGCSNYSAWHLMKALGVSERHGLERFVSQQIHYSAIAREAEYELVPIALDQGVGIMVWSPLAGGFLSGKFSRDAPPASDTRRAGRGDPYPIDEEQGFAVLDVLREVAEAHDASVAQAALRWLLHQPGVSTVVVGARTDAQLADNLGAIDWEMTADELEGLEEVSAPPLIYPYWHQAQFVTDRSGPADHWPRRQATAELPASVH